MAKRKESQSRPPFRFLGLPLEVRRKIYLLMRIWPSEQHHAVLRVSKQIHAEARESFYQRALVCSSQSDLISTVFKFTPVVLNRIQTLVVTLEEWGWSKHRNELLKSVTGEPVCGTDELYYKDLQSVVTCLSRLPNVTELTILGPRQSYVAKRMQNYFASLTAWVTQNYTQIESLTLTAKNTTLGFISALSNLQSLTFCGFSLTTSAEAVEIFRRLDHLKTLSLIRPERSPDCFNNGARIVRSLDGEVLRSMKPLKAFTLLDCVDENNECDDDPDVVLAPQHMNEDIFHALREKHSDSIQKLTIRSTFDVTSPTHDAMLSFICSATALQTLRLDLVDTDIRNLERFSRDLRCVEIVLCNEYLPSFGEADLSSVHHALPQLRELKYTVYRQRSGRLLCRFTTEDYGKKR